MLKRFLVFYLFNCASLINPSMISAGETTTEQPVFCFWRNLPERISVYQEIGETLVPLEPSIAEKCCSVHPGQNLTLIRSGKAVGTGQISDIFAANIPRAGDSRMVFFEVAGFSDSLNIGTGCPSFPRRNDSVYDMFVVGDLEIEELFPKRQQWSELLLLPPVLKEAASKNVISGLALLNMRDSSGNPVRVTPDSLGTSLNNLCDLSEYSVWAGNSSIVLIQTIKPQSGSRFPSFVRVSYGQEPKHVLIPGVLDYFLKIEGVPYMVLRNGKYASGAWGYFIYRLNSSKPPERIHEDGSWST